MIAKAPPSDRGEARPATDRAPEGGIGGATIAAEGPVSGYARDALAETSWVAERLGDDSVRIVEVDESIVTYEEGHIPGAIGLEWKRDLQDPVRRDVLGPDDFGDLMGSRGISNRHAVVLYGDRDNWFAAYAYWCLVYYGHRRVKLLNGARAKWVAEGRPLSTEAARYPEADFAARAPDEAIRARRDGVRDALDTATRIVDVRNPGEFTGEMVAVPGYEHEAPQRSGHIPGATSVPWASALREDGTFKPVDELRDLYAAAATEDERVIVYCLLGGRSAHTWFALHELLGVDSAANYDGGWSEWGAMIDVPIETGP